MSLAIFSVFLIASSDQTPPVGLLGELMIMPFIDLSILLFRSSKSGSNCFWAIVSTKIGSAPAILTNSGKETQYGEI